LFKQRLLGAVTALVALAAFAPGASAAGTPSVSVPSAITAFADAAGCQGLACPGVLPAASAASAVVMPTVAPEDLTTIRTSGFYAYAPHGAAAGQRAVAYVVAPGTWASAPAEIKQLPLADDLLPEERTSKWMVIYGPGTMASGPWPVPAAAARASRHKPGGATAHTAALTDCTSPWFCTWTGGTFNDTKCQWQDTGVWQDMGSCYMAASSMANRRNAYSLLKRYSDGRNYCALPNSSDASLDSNGFNNNTYIAYDSTAAGRLPEWNCAN
jgi:hypothetical protein